MGTLCVCHLQFHNGSQVGCTNNQCGLRPIPCTRSHLRGIPHQWWDRRVSFANYFGFRFLKFKGLLWYKDSEACLKDVLSSFQCVSGHIRCRTSGCPSQMEWTGGTRQNIFTLASQFLRPAPSVINNLNRSLPTCLSMFLVGNGILSTARLQGYNSQSSLGKESDY